MGVFYLAPNIIQGYKGYKGYKNFISPGLLKAWGTNKIAM